MGLNRKNDFDLDFGPLKGIKSNGSEVIYLNNENYSDYISGGGSSCTLQICEELKTINFADPDTMLADAFSGSYSLFETSRATITFPGTASGFWNEQGPVDSGMGGTVSRIGFSGIVDISEEPSDFAFPVTYFYQDFDNEPFYRKEIIDLDSRIFALYYNFTKEPVGGTSTNFDVSHTLKLVDGNDGFEGRLFVSLEIDGTGAYVLGTGTYSFQTPQYMNI